MQVSLKQLLRGTDAGAQTKVASQQDSSSLRGGSFFFALRLYEPACYGAYLGTYLST